MRVAIDRNPTDVTDNYRKRMYSPLCGIVTSVGYSLRSRTGPRVFVAGGELTGVHELLHQEPPKAGSYHIGGSGVHPFEPEIRVYAEAAERYSSAVALLHSKFSTRWTSYSALVSEGEPVLDEALLTLRPPGAVGGPYDSFNRDAPMTWVLVPRVKGLPASMWIPSQLFFVGYTPRREEGEPWLQAAVTTGTAVHTSYPRAIAAAAYEIIQVDATMGHWYGTSDAVRIGFDSRTTRIESLLAKHTDRRGYKFDFYFIPSPDLPSFSVACVIAEAQGRAPVVSIGLGADSSLERAMYKAFLEGSGVRTLAEWGLISHQLDSPNEELDPALMFDLDSNVSYYAAPGKGESVLARFSSANTVPASTLPADLDLDEEALALHLLDSFVASGKDIFCADITPIDIAEIGFKAVRLWCPQTLALCLPSAPAVSHPRFLDYGGFTHSEPHPYP